jgi:hypothetical protein
MNKKTTFILGGISVIILIFFVLILSFLPTPNILSEGINAEELLNQTSQSKSISVVDYPNFNETTNFTWNPSTQAFRFTGNNYSFDIALTVFYLGTERTLQDIKNTFPEVNIGDYVNYGNSEYKFYIEFTNVPSSLAQNIDFFRYEIVDWENLTLDDIDRIENFTFEIAGENILSFQDLIDSNYTLNKTSLLVVDVYGDAQHFVNGTINLDPTIVPTSDLGSGNIASWNHRLFYDHNNDRWHTLYIDNGSDIHTASAPWNDQSTWTDGIDINSALSILDYDDFDCAIDFDGSTTYLHCVYSDTTDPDVYYHRVTLTGSSPFITAGTEDIPFNDTLAGVALQDDSSFPRVAMDSNDCVLIAVDVEDASEATADEHEVVLIKEDAGTGCGDGDFDYDDIETGFPIYSVQTDGVGYAEPFPIGIESFGDLDAQIMWVDSDGSGNLETIYFNGTSNSVGTQVTLEASLSWTTSYASHWSVITGNRTITFGENTTLDALLAYITTTKDDTSADNVDTGLNMEYAVSTQSSAVTAIVDNNSVGGDDIWVLATDDTDLNDIYYANSTDGGDTWNNPVLWQDETGKNIRYLSAYFDWEHNQSGVSWFTNDTDPFILMFDTFNTTVTVGADSCTCAGLNTNWEIDFSDSCLVYDNCDLGTGNITWTGTGTTIFNATIEAYKMDPPPSGGLLKIGPQCLVKLG